MLYLCLYYSRLSNFHGRALTERTQSWDGTVNIDSWMNRFIADAGLKGRIGSREFRDRLLTVGKLVHGWHKNRTAFFALFRPHVLLLVARRAHVTVPEFGEDRDAYRRRVEAGRHRQEAALRSKAEERVRIRSLGAQTRRQSMAAMANERTL